MNSNSVIFNPFVLFFTSILFFFFVFTARSQSVLGIYKFNGNPIDTTQSHEVEVQPSYATFSAFSRTKPLNYSPGIDYFNTKSWDKTLNTNKYIEFTITAKPGYILKLDKLYLEQYRSASGPTHFRIVHNGTGNFETTTGDILTSTTLPSNLKANPFTWDFPDITIPAGGSVTFRLFAWNPTSGLGAIRLDNVTLYGTMIPDVLINEFHYYNTTNTKNSFVELLVPKDFTHLPDVSVALYDAGGRVYFTETLANFATLAKAESETETDKIYYLDIPAGMVNGPGGISVNSMGKVLQFLSYGGAITALDGPAAGLTSEDIGVVETAADGTGNSIYLMPSVENMLAAGPADGTVSDWAKYDENTNTKGRPNELVVTLPVDLLYFKAKITNRGVELKWETGMEKNNSFFEIEKSTDARQFQRISSLKGMGTTAGNTAYLYLDKNILGTAYYRLKQVDGDGSFTYSPVISVTQIGTATGPSFRIYPNPVIDKIQVELTDAKQKAVMQVMDLQGRLVLTQNILPENIPVVDVSLLRTGQYILRVFQGSQIWSQQFVKQ